MSNLFPPPIRDKQGSEQKEMKTVFQKLAKEKLTLRGRIAEQIRDAILNGTLDEGERIVERKLAAQFGASLTVIREAIVQLEGEGFITKRPNSSTHVTTLSVAEAKKIFACRRVFEGFATAEAARLASAEVIDSLERHYLQMLEAARVLDAISYVSADLSFHRLIWKMSGNEYLQSSIEGIVLPLYAFSSIRMTSHRSFDLLQDTYLHLPILNAIKAKNPLAARRALESAMKEWESQLEWEPQPRSHSSEQTERQPA
jgi:DNA-binding GntR family transcriptional regulator